VAGSTSLAVRTIVDGTQNTLNWTLSDHLGSSSITTTANGTWYSELRYSAFGETRYSSGITPTDYRYTGQLEQADVNLYYYNARWYDPELGRFIQADTIVPEPGSAKSYDRYTYVNNNPVRYTDPSGHAAVPFSVCQVAGARLASHCNSVYGPGASQPSTFNSGNTKSSPTASVKEYQKILASYGVTLVDGSLTGRDALEITIGVQSVASKLSSSDPQSRSSGQVFRDEFGPIQIQSKDAITAGMWSCDHNGYGFYCMGAAGKWDRYLVAHELGHDFAQANGKTPYDMMFSANQFNDLGMMVFGSVNGTYNRTFLGMNSNKPPDVYHGDTFGGNWNSSNEDFADTFLNWINDSFNYDTESIIDGMINSNSGFVRKEWMDVNMVEWLIN
jgi:RHS repeat-associated protein